MMMRYRAEDKGTWRHEPGAYPPAKTDLWASRVIKLSLDWRENAESVDTIESLETTFVAEPVHCIRRWVYTGSGVRG